MIYEGIVNVFRKHRIRTTIKGGLKTGAEANKPISSIEASNISIGTTSTATVGAGTTKGVYQEAEEDQRRLSGNFIINCLALLNSF